MSAKEANARIKINKLLEEAGWRFFGTLSGKAWTERLYQALNNLKSTFYWELA
jgi:hypothetical protein